MTIRLENTRSKYSYRPLIIERINHKKRGQDDLYHQLPSLRYSNYILAICIMLYQYLHSGKRLELSSTI